MNKKKEKEIEKLIDLRVHFAQIGDYDKAWEIQGKINKLSTERIGD